MLAPTKIAETILASANIVNGDEPESETIGK
jgi:hypothetical protein